MHDSWIGRAARLVMLTGWIVVAGLGVEKSSFGFHAEHAAQQSAVPSADPKVNAGAAPAHVDQTIVDVEGAKKLEAQIKSVQAIARAVSVGLEILDEGVANSSGSGTIISKDGWIMTAGHVYGKPGLDVTIYFADGTKTQGKTSGLNWDGLQDCGLIRFDPSGLAFPVAQIGTIEGVQEGDWIISFGHTFGIEKEPFRPPVLRLGRIIGMSDSVLRIDTPLSSGDSGGGVFDLDGRLIGINSTAGPEPDMNSATAIDFASAHLSDMQQDAAAGADAQAEREGKPRRAGPNGLQLEMPAEYAPFKNDPKNLEGIGSTVDNAMGMTVGVFVDNRIVSYGTVASANGFIIAKASEVGMTSADLSVALPDGLTVRGRRMGVDEQLDLMLIATDETFDEPHFASETIPAIGSLLVTVGRNGSADAIAVRSLDAYTPGRSEVTGPYLGVAARPMSEEEKQANGNKPGVILMRVEPGGPAAKAGLKNGDCVMSIDGVVIENQPEVGVAVRTHAAGDVIDVVRTVDGKDETMRVRLAVRPRPYGPPPSSMRFPASRRSSGFGPIIQHDGNLRADQMGGPVVDLDGNVVAVNVARADRTKTYALSAAVVKEAIDRLIEKAKDRKEPLALIDPLQSGIVINQQGSALRLDASTAEIVGTRLSFARGEDSLDALVMWIDPNDSAHWLVEFNKTGDYAVRVMQSCPSEFAEQDFAVMVGGVILQAKTKATADWTDFQGVDVGTFHVETTGRAIVKIKTGGKLKGPLMNLHAIELKRMS